MALPIKNTPTLTGRDAIEFLKQIKENETKSISKEEFERIEKNYKAFKAITDKNEYAR